MTQRLLRLAVVLGLLAALAVYLWIFGKPASPAKSPLEGVDLGNISKVTVDGPRQSVVLEKRDGVWKLAAPVQDLADPLVMEDIRSALETFSLGSVISENPAKHVQFMIDDAQGMKLRVYIEGKEGPVLDGVIGKRTPDFQDCYFRFAASTPVYVVSGIPSANWERDVPGYRMASVLSLKADDVTVVKVTQDKFHIELARSSNTWTNKADGKFVDPYAVNGLLQKLAALPVLTYGTGQEKPETLGFKKPFASVHAETIGKPASFVVGGTVPGGPNGRYVRSEGRDALLVVSSDALTDLLTPLKNLAK